MARGLRTAATAAVVAVVTAACGGSSNGTSTEPTPATSSARPTTTQAPTATPSTTTAAPTPVAFRYLPLWPFASVAAARTWQSSGAAGGWHDDAAQTALKFTRDYLHITDVDRVTSRSIGSRDARVGVGFATEGGRTGTAAVVHVVRIGVGAGAPWEVVGTDDTTLSLTKPAYGATATSPTTVGGRISGVDESLRVTVRTLKAAAPVGSACCAAAGGDNQPWTMRVSFSATPGDVVTIVVTTGGHIHAVERFAVTGVRAG